MIIYHYWTCRKDKIKALSTEACAISGNAKKNSVILLADGMVGVKFFVCLFLVCFGLFFSTQKNTSGDGYLYRLCNFGAFVMWSFLTRLVFFAVVTICTPCSINALSHVQGPLFLTSESVEHGGLVERISGKFGGLLTWGRFH